MSAKYGGIYGRDCSTSRDDSHCRFNFLSCKVERIQAEKVNL